VLLGLPPGTLAVMFAGRFVALAGSLLPVGIAAHTAILTMCKKLYPHSHLPSTSMTFQGGRGCAYQNIGFCITTCAHISQLPSTVLKVGIASHTICLDITCKKLHPHSHLSSMTLAYCPFSPLSTRHSKSQGYATSCTYSIALKLYYLMLTLPCIKSPQSEFVKMDI